ncbi:MAG: response regulator transcription factor [Candidatus Omnitrophica bacterium]|nr:response regulator transcription factor [Candidatus Omnitrophota bacterium]
MFMSTLIAIVDDEPDICELVSLHLKKAGFQTKEFLNGNDFLAFLRNTTPDLVVLDLMLPDTDGLEICKYIRTTEHLKPLSVIMLTAKGEEIDRVLGLELGADDYITKPFSPKELVARVKAVLRRKAPVEEARKLRIGKSLVVDLEKYEVLLDEKKIDVTPTEFRILQILSTKKGKVFTRDHILDHLWGDEKVVVDRTIDVHIRHLREKLGRAGNCIKNVRGIGYKLET